MSRQGSLSSRPSLLLRIPIGPIDSGGVTGLNSRIAEILSRRFKIVEEPERADLQVCSLDWSQPSHPPRCFIDHGSFADPGFWTYTAQHLRTGDIILVSSRVCLKVADRLFGTRRPEIRLVPFPIDLGTFRPGDHDAARRDVASRLGFAPTVQIVLVVAGYSRRKNQHLALRMFAELLKHNPQARLVLVGRAESGQQAYLDDLRRQVSELGLGESVRFVDIMSPASLAELMRASKLLLHYSTCRLENFGLVVAEAMACGLPVVAADWGGFQDLVLHGQTGFLAGTYISTHGPRVDWQSPMKWIRNVLQDQRQWETVSVRSAQAAQRLASAVFEETVVATVSTAIRRGGSQDRCSLSALGQDLMFGTLSMHRRNNRPVSTGREYRELLRVEGGRFTRLLSGPAATLEYPPDLDEDCRLYTAVSWVRHQEGVTVTDPAWQGLVPLDEDSVRFLHVAEKCLSVREIARCLAVPVENTLLTASKLVKAGLVCPLGIRISREALAG